jgi:DNA-binding transcriptional LysR family regulator
VELRQLEHFVAVAEEQQFTRAARRCNLSQSALSASIKGLERELGAQLFVRTTRRVEPSDAGRVLLDKARRILGDVATAQDAVNATLDRLGGALALGGVTTRGVLDQPGLLAHFHAQHPEVELKYSGAPSLLLMDEVRAGHIDLAFVSVPARPPRGIAFTALASHPSVLICRPDHPLAGREIVELDDLADETIIGGPLRSLLNETIARAYRGTRTARRPTIQVADIESVFDFVASGLGVGLLPGYFLVPPRSELVVVPLTDPAMVWTVGMVAALPEHRTRATAALMEMVPGFVAP